MLTASLPLAGRAIAFDGRLVRPLTPSPLVGEGGEGGLLLWSRTIPLPNPPHKGGGDTLIVPMRPPAPATLSNGGFYLSSQTSAMSSPSTVLGIRWKPFTYE